MSATPATRSTTFETPIQFSVELVTDPVGVALSAEVNSQLPDPAAEALMDDVEAKLVGQQGNLVFQSIRVANGALRGYASRNDYDMDPIADSVELLETSRTGRRLTARWGWQHEAAKYFQFGVSPHTIDGNPILSFIWEDAPQGVREMFANTERVGGDPRVFFQSVDHPGVPESRYVQAGINWLRQELR